MERTYPIIETAANRRALIDELLAHGEKLPFYFKLRLVAKGPFVAAKIGRFCCCTVNGDNESREHEWSDSCDRHPSLAAEINGQPYPVERALKGGQLIKITKEQFEFLRDAAAWDRTNDPDAPLATPNQKIDLTTMKVPF